MSENTQILPRRKRPKRKRHLWRKLLVYLLVMAVIAGAGYYAWSSLKSEYTIRYTGYMASIGSYGRSGLQRSLQSGRRKILCHVV